MKQIVLFFVILIFITGCKNDDNIQLDSVSKRIGNREFPSIFQAWNSIDQKILSLETNEQRILIAAKHDLLWEDVVSQEDGGVGLVLGAVWDSAYCGLASKFSDESEKRALANREKMQELNPNMIFLLELRWKDAPGSYLPENSEWWKRDVEGACIPASVNGTDTLYYLDYQNDDFQKQVQLQAAAALGSGVYDGVMLDGWGLFGEREDTCIYLLGKIREAMGEDGIILVDNDRIAPLPNSAPYVNGAYMEMTQKFHDQKGDWPNIMNHLWWFESNFREPRVNCLEIQAGDEEDLLTGMAISLIFSSGYYLYSKVDNSDPAPDHIHLWHQEFDWGLGGIVGPKVRHEEGYYSREFENGFVLYNPVINDDCEIWKGKFGKGHQTINLKSGKAEIIRSNS